MNKEKGEIRLSGCLMVRNEEKFLEACLLSLKGIADEVIIVDTGSTDQTLGIARRFTEAIYSFPWSNDFSAPRNFALEKAHGKWILSIDADERIRPISAHHLHAQLLDCTRIAYSCLIFMRRGLTPTRTLRLFRNDPRIRFQGIIHENIADQIRRVASQDRLQIGEGDLAIDHLGYEGDLLRKKCERNLPLLLRALEGEPGNILYRSEIGFTYYILGKLALAEAALEGSVARVRRSGDPPPHWAYPYARLIQLRLTQGGKVVTLLAEAMERFPETPTLYWLQGKALMAEKKYAQAIPFFERLLAWGRKTDYRRSMAYEEKIFDVYAYDSLGVCYFKLGRYPEAAENYTRAEQYEPGLEYRVKKELCFHHAQKNIRAGGNNECCTTPGRQY